MEHPEFVNAYRRGAVDVDVDRTKALQLANAWEKLPHQFRTAHLFWTWSWLLAIPAAFAAAFFYAWWAGALILFLVMPALFAAARKSAALHVIDYAVESSAFYSYAVENGLIRVREKV